MGSEEFVHEAERETRYRVLMTVEQVGQEAQWMLREEEASYK